MILSVNYHRNNIATTAGGGIALISTITPSTLPTDRDQEFRKTSKDFDTRFYDCEIRNNTATQGGGIYLDVTPATMPNFDGAVIEDNVANQFGGGVFIGEYHAVPFIFKASFNKYTIISILIHSNLSNL